MKEWFLDRQQGSRSLHLSRMLSEGSRRLLPVEYKKSEEILICNIDIMFQQEKILLTVHLEV